MKRRIRFIVAAAAVGTVVFSGSAAYAAPGDNGNGVGGCISGNLYGNTSNPRPSGHGVLPSQAPGPSVNNPADPDNPIKGGLSVGGVHQAAHDGFGAPAGNYTGRDVNEVICTFP
jgi:hypothetical protein